MPVASQDARGLWSAITESPTFLKELVGGISTFLSSTSRTDSRTATVSAPKLFGAKSALASAASLNTLKLFIV